MPASSQKNRALRERVLYRSPDKSEASRKAPKHPLAPLKHKLGIFPPIDTMTGKDMFVKDALGNIHYTCPNCEVVDTDETHYLGLLMITKEGRDFLKRLREAGIFPIQTIDLLVARAQTTKESDFTIQLPIHLFSQSTEASNSNITASITQFTRTSSQSIAFRTTLGSPFFADFVLKIRERCPIGPEPNNISFPYYYQAILEQLIMQPFNGRWPSPEAPIGIRFAHTYLATSELLAQEFVPNASCTKLDDLLTQKHDALILKFHNEVVVPFLAELLIKFSRHPILSRLQSDLVDENTRLLQQPRYANMGFDERTNTIIIFDPFFKTP